MEELVDLVLSLTQEIKEKIPNINQGGCGVFAFLVTQELQSRGYNPEIVILVNRLERRVDKKKEVLNNIFNGNKVARGEKVDTSFAHCYLNVGGLVFDGTSIGIKLKDRWSCYATDGTYTLEELKLALKVGGWNPTYSRRRQTPILLSLIHI